MKWSLVFFANSILLGVGLAMDAFSVSLADGLHEPKMRKAKMYEIAGVFAGFQGLMPLTGWFCVHTIVQYFKAFEKFIPWIALALLCYIGGKMIWEGMHDEEEEEGVDKLGLHEIVIQGVATSIDALSVGFTIAEYGWLMAFVCALIIAVVTFFICFMGIEIGKHFGTKISHKAEVFGGVILVLIGLEIFITGVF